MEKITIPQNITVVCVTATSFPKGLLVAHQQLHTVVPQNPERRYFGISRPEQGVIVYKAAAEELVSGELDSLQLETFTIKSGEFNSIELKDYQKDLSSIGNAFSKLLDSPDLDLDGYCLEWYLTDTDMRCLVPLKK